ncbi:MAG: type I secretion system permease/ATPase [Alphaproteobacteria bacterium]
MGRCRRAFGAVVLFSLCINLLLLTSPLYMLQIYDRVLNSRSVETLIYLSLIAVFAFAILAALEMARSRVLSAVGTWLDRRLAGPVLSASIIAGVDQTRPSAEAMRDVTTFRTFLAGPSIFPFLDSPWTPIFIVVIFLLHPMIGWLALGGAVVLFTLAILNEVATRGTLLKAGQASQSAMRDAESAVRNADVVEAMGMMPNMIARWSAKNAQTLALQERASNRSGVITAISKFVRQGLQLGVLGFGAWFVLLNEMTPGGMIAGSILMARALAPVEQAIGAWRSFVAARQAYRRIKQRLAASPVRGEQMKLPRPDGALSVESITYAYPGSKEPDLKGISFSLEPGESLGLIGPTAAGKTTLARILVGNLRPQHGHARLDGADINEWNPEDRGSYIGYLPQDTELFNGTARENIARMGEGDAGQIIEAAKLADVHEIILGLPEGYETELGDGGAILSGGQRQRVGLARAVYGGPAYVVLDEPGASLDQIGEQALLNTLIDLKKRKSTIIVIAHRPNILQLVDKILVLRDGQVAAFGPRDEVLAKVAGPRGQPAAD